MKNINDKGLVIIMVVVIMALIGTTLLYLSSSSNTMIFQTNDAYLKACQRNLITSGLTWAKSNIKKNNNEYFDKMIELNIIDVNLPKSNLAAKIISKTNNSREVQIISSSSSGKHNIKSDNFFILSQ
jgi:hypothetical protein